MSFFLKTLMLPAYMAIGLAAGAQVSGQAAVAPQTNLKEGKIVYERTTQLQINLQGMDENMARRLPRSRTDNFELQFAPGKSLWQYLPSAAEDAGGTVINSGGSIQVFRTVNPDEVTFANLEEGKTVTKRELDSKNYLVDETIQKLPWKLTAETKTILGYVAHKAVAQQFTTRTIMNMENGEMKTKQQADTVNVVAWFTQNIPVPAGPVFQGQLPGVILELDMNGGRIVYKAVEVSPKVNADNIKEPKGGKRITSEEFAKVRQQMLEEMRKNGPANRTFRMSN